MHAACLLITIEAKGVEGGFGMRRKWKGDPCMSFIYGKKIACKRCNVITQMRGEMVIKCYKFKSFISRAVLCVEITSDLDIDHLKLIRNNYIW